MSSDYTTIEFAGLTNASDVEMNDSLRSKYDLDEDEDVGSSLSMAISNLDPVELADLYVENPYNEEQLIPISKSNATINPDTAIELAEKAAQPETVGGFQFGGDDDADELTVEDGDTLTYATHSSGYAAVPHYDFFFPMATALREAEIDNLAGQFRIYDNGAQVHGEIVFQEPESQLHLPEDRDPLFVGLSVGNSYDGTCSMYAMGYAQDTFCNNSMRNLTDRRTRKHVGEPDEVSEWWNSMLLQMTAMRDLLGECIGEALEVEMNFLEQPFDVEEFYELLGLPGYLARAAATTARNRSPREGGTRSTINFWTLHSGLTSALTHDFSGSSEVGALETYSQIAKDILWNPVNTVSQVKVAYERQQQQEDEDSELGGKAAENVAIIEQYESSLEDRKAEFEDFENQVNGLLAEAE